MAREIKFRGKSTHTNDWVYGNYVGNCDEPTICGFDIYQEGSAEWQEEKVEEFSICQYTGLKDKNGTDIYEGDIVHLDAWSPYAMQVVFMEGSFCLANKDGEFLGDIHYIHHAGVEQCTILGNIHDDPELLNKEGSNDM